MKTQIFSLLIFSLIGFITISCENENKNGNSNQFVLSGQLIYNSTCKTEFKTTSNTSDTFFSCVEYSFAQTNNKLIIKHINVIFNCCPDSLYVQTSLNGDTIIIREHEANKGCDCNCFYDLDIELNGVVAKKYMIQFIEPYITDQQEILFEADLANNSEGGFCVTRNPFP